MSYIIGLDAGGTSTTIECFNSALKLISSFRKPPLHASLQSAEDIASKICSYVKEVSTHFEGNPPARAACGIAGATKDIQPKITVRLNQLMNDVHWFVTSDVRAAHTGAFNGRDGALVIAGTGTVVLARYQNTWYKSGGYGPLIGDPGSGRMLGKKILQTVCMDFDADRKTDLLKAICEKLSVSSKQHLISRINNKPSLIPSLTESLFKLAHRGDKVSASIADMAAKAITNLTGTVLNKMPEQQYTVVLHGGLFKSGYFKQNVQKSLENKFEFILFTSAQYSAAKGVCLMMPDK